MVLAKAGSSPAILDLPREFHNLVDVMCDAFESLDLRIETTLGNAAQDLRLSLPEITGHDGELERLAAMLVCDIRVSTDGNMAQPVLLELTFSDKNDLMQKLQATINAIEVV